MTRKDNPANASRGRALVIFDLDGTLFQTRRVTIPAVQQTFASNGLVAPREDEIGSYIGRPPQEYYDWLAGYCTPGQAERIIAETDRRELELVGEVGCLYSGIPEMLADLAGAGFMLALSSNAPESYFRSVLDTQNLWSWFNPAYCSGTRFSSKKEIVGTILGERPAHVFAVVGDRKDDIESAHAHGGFAVAVTYGFGTEAELANADAIVSSPGAVTDALRSLLRGAKSARE